MAENKLDKKVLQKEIRDISTALKKSEDNAVKKKDKIDALQAELDELNKEIESLKEQLTEKETLMKKADYSTVLDKLDNAALSTLSKRQAEQLIKMITSGDIAALLGNDNTEIATNSNPESAVATSSNDKINDVDTNINNTPYTVATSINAELIKKEGV